MSDRERWIVYPLLFLALGATFRDKMSNRIDIEVLDAKIVRCNQLLVSNEEGKPQVVVSSTPDAITTYSREGKPLVQIGSIPFQVRQDQKVESGIVTVNGYDGKPVIALRANYKAVLSKRPVVSEDAEGNVKQQIVEVRGYDGGGQIEVFDRTKRLALALEYYPGVLGLILRTPQGGIPLAVVRTKNEAPRETNLPDSSGSDESASLPSAPEPKSSSPPDGN